MSRRSITAIARLASVISCMCIVNGCGGQQADSANSSNINYGIVATIPAGKFPGSAALDSIDHLLYVANLEGASVSVIDTATNRLIDTIPVPVGPFFIGVDSASHTAYVVCSGAPPDGAGHTVAIIRNRSHDVEQVSTDRLAVGIAVNPDTHRAYVGVGGDSVGVIDGASATVQAEVPVGHTLPVSFAVDSVSDDVYVGLNDRSTPESIVVLDGVSNSIKSSVSVGHASFAIARDDQSGRVFSVGRATDSSSDNLLSVIDGTSAQTTATIREDVLALVVDQLGDLVLVAPQTGNLVRFVDKHSGTVVSQLPVSDAMGYPAVDSQTHKFYLPLVHKHQILVLAPTT